MCLKKRRIRKKIKRKLICFRHKVRFNYISEERQKITPIIFPKRKINPTEQEKLALDRREKNLQQKAERFKPYMNRYIRFSSEYQNKQKIKRKKGSKFKLPRGLN